MKTAKKDRLEVSSDQLRAELVEIKERVGALETIASISNRAEVESYVKGQVTSDKARQILKECEEPRSREYLIATLKFSNRQALDYYLGPLRDADIIHQHFNEDEAQTFVWSNLFKRLPKATLKRILGVTKPNTAESGKVAAVRSSK